MIPSPRLPSRAFLARLPRLLRAAVLWAPMAGASSLLADEGPITSFPVVIHAGAGAAGDEELPADPDGRVLPDLPFRTERGHGVVGGRLEKLGPAAVFGGKPSWRGTWWEGIEKLILRLPHGEYLVELSFIETDVAAAGLRVFDVFAEDAELFPRLDIARKAGDFTWLTLKGIVPVFDGWLDLRFVPVTGERPPRLSRIRVLPAPAAREATPLPPPAALKAIPGPGRVLLRWDRPAPAAAAAYGVFRADGPDGPFEPLTPEPWLLTSFEDLTAPAGRERFYKVVAYGVRGEQSLFSPAVSAAARVPESLGLKVYDLRVPEEALRQIGMRGSTAEAVGELRHLGAIHYVRIRCDSTPLRWQRKKSFHIEPDEERNRTFLRRSRLHLSAEAGDPTLLREKLSADASQLVGLATPLVEPVVLLLNGRSLGLYFDIEPLETPFRQRNRLDRVGLLVRLTDGDLLREDWTPYGEQVGEEGNLLSLTELVHELNRLGSGESLAFFEDRFYLERWLDRAALSIARGEPDRPAALRFLLRDSRNSKWELLQDRHGSGAWGIHDFAPVSPLLDAARARTLIFPPSSLQGGGFSISPSGSPSRSLSMSPSILETRFFSERHLEERLLDRVEKLITETLSPEKLDLLVDHAFSIVKEAALQDIDRWPDPAAGDAALLEGPAMIKASYRARVAAIRAAIANERSRPPATLVLNEVLLRGGPGDEPWVEVRNASSAPLPLRGWFIARDARPLGDLSPASSGTARFPDRALAPGESLVVRFGGRDGPPLSASGGFLGLYEDVGPRPALRDALFYGHQTAGISYGRAPGGGLGRWVHLSPPTPGGPNEGTILEPPPYDFRQGITSLGPEGLTIWWKTRAPGGDEPKVRLARRKDGGGEAFETVDLSWDDKAFRHAVRFGAGEGASRAGYYFLASSPGGVERAYPLAAPELLYFLPVLPPLKINEVLPRPGQGAETLGEFIEVYNPTEEAIDLEGFFLSDSTRNPTKWRIPRGNVIGPKGFLLFYADGKNEGNHAGFRLSNSGEFIGLFGRMEEGNLQIDGIAYRGMKTGESWGSSPDGTKSYRVWKDPTPGARNMPKIPKEFLEKSAAEAR